MEMRLSDLQSDYSSTPRNELIDCNSMSEQLHAVKCVGRCQLTASVQGHTDVDRIPQPKPAKSVGCGEMSSVRSENSDVLMSLISDQISDDSTLEAIGDDDNILTGLGSQLKGNARIDTSLLSSKVLPMTMHHS